MLEDSVCVSLQEWYNLLENNFFVARSVQIAIDELQLCAASGSDASPDHRFAQRKAISLSDTTVSIAFPGPSVHMSPAIVVEETELTLIRKKNSRPLLQITSLMLLAPSEARDAMTRLQDRTDSRTMWADAVLSQTVADHSGEID